MPVSKTDSEVLEPTEVETPRGAEAAHRSQLAKTKAALAAQPKVTVKVQDDTYVAVNGYGFLIKGKTKVAVPEQVADILEEAGRI